MDLLANIKLAGNLSLDGVHETATLTTKPHDDFVVANLDKINLIVFTSTGDVDLKGLDASDLTGWHMFYILNANTFDSKLKLKKNQASSAAANRFFIKDDIEINKGEFYLVMYNPTQQRFHVHAKE